jgi:hypothetical protein
VKDVFVSLVQAAHLAGEDYEADGDSGHGGRIRPARKRHYHQDGERRSHGIRGRERAAIDRIALKCGPV